MGLISRTKGQRGEREAAEFLADLLGIPVARIGQTCGRRDGADVKGIDGLHVEVKYSAEVPKTIYNYFEQAAEDAGDDVSAVMMKRVEPNTGPGGARPWLIVVEAHELLRLADLIRGNR